MKNAGLKPSGEVEKQVDSNGKEPVDSVGQLFIEDIKKKNDTLSL